MEGRGGWHRQEYSHLHRQKGQRAVAVVEGLKRLALSQPGRPPLTERLGVGDDAVRVRLQQLKRPTEAIAIVAQGGHDLGFALARSHENARLIVALVL